MLQGAFSQPAAPPLPAEDDGIPQGRPPVEKRTDSVSYGSYGPPGSYSSSYYSSGSDAFYCDNDIITHQAYVCDGDNDCYDCSDELGIDCDMDCEIGFWNPGYYGPYAPYSSYGSYDLDDSGVFQCANGNTTSAGYVCDGDNDCYDCSDELGIGCEMDCEIGFWNPGYYGPYAPYSSYGSDNSGVFQCANGNTTSAGYVCDGDNDCYDCSDELGIGCDMDCDIGFWNPGNYGPYAPYSSYGSYGSYSGSGSFISKKK